MTSTSCRSNTSRKRKTARTATAASSWRSSCRLVHEELRDDGGAEERAGVRRERDHDDPPAQRPEHRKVFCDRKAGERQQRRGQREEVDLSGQRRNLGGERRAGV